MKNQFRIGNKTISDNDPCFIIAEAGVNHNGEIEKGLELVKIAKDCGANAVKFQLFNAHEQISKHALNAPYQRKGSGKKTMLEMADSYDFAWENHKALADYANELGIIYMSSCFDTKAVDFFINQLGGDCIKTGSGEITNYPLLKHISSTGLPIILSTGMCDLDDVEAAVNYIKSNGKSTICLLHCVSSYPAAADEINIRSISTLKEKFELIVGYSDHTLDNTAAIAAIALGAKVIEKHFTIDNELSGPDHAMSLNPSGLANYISQIRTSESLMGDGIKRPSLKEIEMQKYSRRGIVSAERIEKGTVLTIKNTSLKRPAIGIDARDLDKIVGKKINRSLEVDEIITKEMIE
jgi:N,N'-diacetyllegionaminate synthase